MASQINTVTLAGYLTRDPELRSLPSGASLCSLRVANNRRRKVNNEWTDVPNFFDVTVWGSQGENVVKYLQKGSAILVRGELRWREWETQEGGKRSAVEINADEVQFIGAPTGRRDSEGDVPIVMDDMPVAAAVPVDDDIPF